MAQQKIIILLALVSVAVGYVAAQSNCVNKLQIHATGYRQETSNIVSNFATELQAHGSNVADTQRFRDHFNKMVNNLVLMVDPQNGVTVTQLSRAYLQFVRDQAELYRSFLDIRNVQGASESYFRLIGSLSDRTYHYLLQAADDCLSGTRREF